MAALWCGATSLPAQTPVVRERVLLDDRWQFVRDDPAGAAGKLAYDKVKAVVETMGTDLVPPSTPTVTLPAPPSGGPGADIAYTHPGFDDRSWRTLNLPHDWGIEGPFQQEYPGDTGKLPWWGVGWYRKHFSLPLADSSKRVFPSDRRGRCRTRWSGSTGISSAAGPTATRPTRWN